MLFFWDIFRSYKKNDAQPIFYVPFGITKCDTWRVFIIYCLLLKIDKDDISFQKYLVMADRVRPTFEGWYLYP